LITLFVFKFISWSVSLGSGTSGGTLAPLFTIGGGLGAMMGSLGISLFPSAGIDVRIAALVGMAGLFAGSARALFASIIFAFETTLQPFGLLPLLAGCSSAYIISGLLMKNTIMTEKIARRGVKIPFEYEADFLDQEYVRNFASQFVISLNSWDTIARTRKQLMKLPAHNLYNYYPVLNKQGDLAGMITLRNIISREATDDRTIDELMDKELHVVFPESSLKESLDQMAESGATVLPVVGKNSPKKIIGILSRSDILKARKKYLTSKHQQKKSISLKRAFKDKPTDRRN
jgi:chloride channel protein, CIC family